MYRNICENIYRTMHKNNKKLQFFIVPFIISFIFIVFAHSMNFNAKYTPLRSEKENAIFLDKSAATENYISVRATRTKVADVFAGKDSLPPFVHNTEHRFIFNEIEKFLGKITEKEFSYSILQRYKKRILLI